MHSIAWAIKDTIRSDFRKNLLAFNMGRKLVVAADLFQGPPLRTLWRETLEEKCRDTIRRHAGAAGRNLADELRAAVAGLLSQADELDETLRRDVVVRAYDAMRFGGMQYARRYLGRVAKVLANDSAENNFAATRAVVHNLAKAMLIKDGPFIAELATSPEKHSRDRKKYNINRSNGDRVTYRHYIHSAIRLGSRRIAYSLSVPHWMLRVLKRMRYLRGLPGWHKAEKDFLARYEAKVDAFAPKTHAEYLQGLAALSGTACMDCLNPRCQEMGCPLESHIPRWIRLAEQRRWKEAVDELHRSNNFPEFTGLICPAPCQGQCKQGAGAYPVQVRGIELEIVEKGFAEGWIAPVPAARKTGRKVAIVGSGPAALAAAQQLARGGHDVTVFEREQEIGGLLRYGIPQFRLDKRFIDRRVEQLRAEGVAFRTGACVGSDVPGGQLRQDFDAVLLATGAARPRDLDVPGRSHAGVYFAMDFLRQQNLAAAGRHEQIAQYINVKDKVVAVIGGGETGNDCVELALMRGARQVHQLEILPAPAPGAARFAAPREHGRNGVDRRWSVATRQFSASGGHITALSGVQVQWYESPNGPVMREKPDGEFLLSVEVALLALGFSAEVDPGLAGQLGLKADEKGRVSLTGQATGAEGVFAAGDFAHGASLVVNAIRSGRDAAKAIDEYLAKKQPEGGTSGQQ
jgi:NAD(P)H-dependent glutamate synthase small subunit